MLIEKKEQLEKKIKEIKERTRKLEEIVMSAPAKIRENHLDSDFFLDVWNLLKS